MSAQRIAVTGIGLTTGVGRNTDECWQAIVDGRSGISKNTLFDTSDLLSSWAGQVPGEQADGIDRCYSLAAMAISEAIEHSDVRLADVEPDRVGVVVGSSLGAMPTLEAAHAELVRTGELDFTAATSSQLPCVADFIAERFGVGGPRVVTSNACAAGAVAIGYAAELLWKGEVDYVICGGVDPLATLSFNGFSCLGAMDPQPCSPMSASTGMTLGEGAGFLILEATDNAADRGAPVLAEVAGYGLSIDGYHQTAPDPGGLGAKIAMAEALRTAGIEPSEVDYVNLHGTGTPTNDAVEPKALKMLFGADRLPPASSTKSMVGHTLGAAGSVEAVCTVLAISRSILPPTVGGRKDAAEDHDQSESSESAGLDIVPDHGRAAQTDVAVSNSFAFGGNNASVVLTRPGYRPDRPAPAAVQRDVVITGAAGLAGTAGDAEALLEALRGGTGCHGPIDGVDGVGKVVFGRADQRRAAKKINPARARRMDPLSILAASAVGDLYAHKGKPGRGEAAETGIVLGTGYGPLTALTSFHRGVVESGVQGANPLIFPNTVVNAAAGHLAMLHRYRGYTATIVGGGTSSVLTLQLAAQVIARGAAERVMVVIADEFPDPAVNVCHRIGGYRRDPAGDGLVAADGAAAILLESAESAAASQATVLGRVLGFGCAGEPAGIGNLAPDGAAWATSLQRALAASALAPEQIDTLVSARSGYRPADTAEEKAIRLAGLGLTDQVTPKSIFGETFGSAAALGIVSALRTEQRVDDRPAGGNVIVSSYAHGGSYAAAVIGVGPQEGGSS